ncbi:hypothetical protein BDV38DRAFT_281742 [Aspergillus pseudotamarii]|uniref:Uncharacterized protein n=1 Tax=Aspergillus pseudotamarii TaxID=132259 RepID=A0A5N6SYH8_ASPPS|nr:uncharacterized protein BDV38DRAFT_281742 [Aspergillus pseudotamarii]KAE8138810.1 hypothetical protein BDV38DRAFT_281742 [Aspergillus pseudotamarii]
MVGQATTILLTLPLLLQILPGAVGLPAPSEDGTLCRNGACGPNTDSRGHDQSGGPSWGNDDDDDDNNNNDEVCTPETVTVTVTAISTDHLPGPTTTIPGPTNTVTITTNGPTETSTITEAFTSTVTDAITSNQVVTDTKTITITVTDAETPTATKATATATSSPTNGADGGDGPDYGTCSDPTIRWADGLDGRTEYSWITNNQDDFPHKSSTTINTLMVFVCNQLRSPCNAPQAVVDRCYSAAGQVSNRGLKGEKASDLWNSLMT